MKAFARQTIPSFLAGFGPLPPATLTLPAVVPKRKALMSARPFRIAVTFLASCMLFQPSAFAEFRVGLVLDRGGKDDKSFNSSAYAGAMEAKSKLSVFVKYVEANDDNAFEPL